MFFSSPEHKVQDELFWSVFVRPYVRQQLLKKQLWNYKAKFNETSHEASLGDRLQKLNKASWLTNNNNRMVDFLFCFKNISETTRPNSMKHHMKLLWVTVYKNWTRRHDWPTTTTEWSTSCFALKTISSETTRPNSFMRLIILIYI